MTASAQELAFAPVVVDIEHQPNDVMVLRTRMDFAPSNERFHDYLARWAKETPDAVFMAERGPDGAWRKTSYAAAYAQARRVAAGLAQRPLGQDKPIMILSGNSVDHQVMALAAMMAGVPYAPISVAYSTVSQDFAKLKHIIGLLDPGLVFVVDAKPFARALAIPEMAGREIVAIDNVDAAPGAKPMSALESDDMAALDARAGSIGPDTIAKILFTSGSTGVPKGVITTHRMMGVTQQQMAALWPFFGEEKPVILDWLPWSHVFGGTFCTGIALRYGGSFYIDDGKPMPSEFPKTVRNLLEISPTFYWSVPKGYEFLLAALNADDALRQSFCRNLKMMFYAGASLPEPVWRALERHCKQTSGRHVPMLTSWGLTETAPSITMVPNAHCAAGNVGVPVPGAELKLIPNRGKLEARVRGPNITPGYWRMPEATHAAFDSEGYFLTGDALLFVDQRDPARGMRFDGRVTEDFKLLTGTWVNVGEIRGRANAALAGLASDTVVTAPDRDDLGLLIIPAPGHIPDDEIYLEKLRQALTKMNAQVSGTSNLIARAIVLETPPSLDSGEITDKGSLNSRLILQNRFDVVDRLYSDDDPDVIIPGKK